MAHDLAGQFVRRVFGDPFPAGLRVQVWHLATRRSRTCETPGEVDLAVQASPVDVYVSASYAASDFPSSRRLSSADSAGIPAAWIDLDVNGGPDQKRGAFPTQDDAIRLAYAIADPTVVVDSGYGIHAWWVFDAPWLLADDTSRQQAQRFVHAWQARHRELAPGVKIDSTHDLARIMRLPGTFNGKGGQRAPVRVIEGSGEPLALNVLLERAGDPPPDPAAGRYDTSGLTVNPEADPPFRKFQALYENHVDFAQAWDGRLPRLRTKSMSERDASVAAYAAQADWTPQELADLIVAHRLKHDPSSGKHARADYVQATVRFVLQGRDEQAHDEVRQRAEAETTAALNEVAEMAHESAPDEERVITLFNRAIASGVPLAPEVVRLRQFGREERTTRYVMTLRDGSEVTLTVAQLIEPARFAAALMAMTGHAMTVPRRATWTAALRVILATREVVEDEEDTVIGEVRELVRQYATHAAVRRHDDEEVENRTPFYDDDCLLIHVGSLLAFARQTGRMSLSRPDILAALRRQGFARETIYFTSRGGDRSSASYFRGPSVGDRNGRPS